MQIVELLDRLRDAVAPHRPQTDDGYSVRTIALLLETAAKTSDEKDAVRLLKNAGPDGDLQVIASHVRTVFRRGMIGVDGWPLK